MVGAIECGIKGCTILICSSHSAFWAVFLFLHSSMAMNANWLVCWLWILVLLWLTFAFYFLFHFLFPPTNFPADDITIILINSWVHLIIILFVSSMKHLPALSVFYVICMLIICYLYINEYNIRAIPVEKGLFEGLEFFLQKYMHNDKIGNIWRCIISIFAP